jgi:hypothetical protein
MKQIVLRVFVMAALMGLAAGAYAGDRQKRVSPMDEQLVQGAFARTVTAIRKATTPSPRSFGPARTLEEARCGYMFTLCYYGVEDYCYKWRACQIKYDEGGLGTTPV